MLKLNCGFGAPVGAEHPWPPAARSICIFYCDFREPVQIQFLSLHGSMRQQIHETVGSQFLSLFHFSHAFWAGFANGTCKSAANRNSNRAIVRWESISPPSGKSAGA